MAYYNGPYEVPPYYYDPFPNGRMCPRFCASKHTGIIKGPAWREGATFGTTQYSNNCSTSHNHIYVLHHSYGEYIVNRVYNQSSVPNNFPGYNMGVTTRVPNRDTEGILYDTHSQSYAAHPTNFNSGLIAYEYDNIENNPDGTFDYDRHRWSTFTYYCIYPSIDSIDLPPGTRFNPDIGTAEPLPGYKWSDECNEYLPATKCIELNKNNKYGQYGLEIFSYNTNNYYDCNGNIIIYEKIKNVTLEISMNDIGHNINDDCGTSKYRTAELKSIILYNKHGLIISEKNVSLISTYKYRVSFKLTETEEKNYAYFELRFENNENSIISDDINIKLIDLGDFIACNDISFIKNYQYQCKYIEQTCCDYVPKDFIAWSDYHNYEHFYGLPPVITKDKRRNK